MRFPVPPPVHKAVSLLRENGFLAYPVGGCVRDTLLGIPPHDWDLTTNAAPENTMDTFRQYPVIQTGIKHGTVTAIVDKMPLEITTFRTDGHYTDHRHPDSVCFSTHIEDDLSRRDFTVNAMALDTERDELIDLFGGAEDLRDGIIRCVGEPQKRFDEDALRILRAMRFAARFGFRIDPDTGKAMTEKAALLQNVSAERIAQELSGLLLAKKPSQIMRDYRDILFTVIPQLSPMADCPQHSIYHDRDVYEHTLLAVDNARPDPVIRWAALLHDAGKPATRVRDTDGKDHFVGHQALSAQIAEQVLNQLKMPRQFIKRVALLVDRHDTVLTEDAVWPLLSDIGSEAFDQLLCLRSADLSAHAAWIRPRAKELRIYAREKERLLSKKACLKISDLCIDGNDLKNAGLQGSEIGNTLSALLHLVVTRRIRNTRDDLEAAVSQLTATDKTNHGQVQATDFPDQHTHF